MDIDSVVDNVIEDIIITTISQVRTTPPFQGGGRKKVKDEMLTRKRKKNVDGWTKNIRKKLKTQGKEYTTVKGKIIPPKVIKAPCSCKRKCYLKLNEDQRLIIFNNFYKLPLEAQNQFIASSVEEFSKKTQRIKINDKPSRRQFSKKYFLSQNNNKIEVCQVMFLNTLAVGLKKIRVVMSKNSWLELVYVQ